MNQVSTQHGTKLRPAGGTLRWLVGKAPWNQASAAGRAAGKVFPPLAPDLHPLLGHLPALRRSRVGILVDGMNQAGDTFRIQVPWMHATVFTDPEHVKTILQLRHENFGKQTRGFDQLRIFLGNGLLTSEGSFWLRQRRIAQPAFHKARLAGFAKGMVKAAEDMADAWARRTDPEIDVSKQMMAVTLRIVSETLLGRDVSAEADHVGTAITALLENVQARMTLPVDVPLHWPTPRNRSYHRAADVIDRVVLDMIAARRKESGRHDDLLAMLIEARDEETGEAMDDRQLRDEVMTIFMAGHETTANALAWTFHLLSLHPTVRERLDAELAAVLGGRSPTIEDLPQLAYTKQIVQESLRLYPPAWVIGRNVVEDDEIGGYFLPKGTLAFVSPYLTHRNPRVWENPEGFDPDRFSPERSAGRHPFAFFPFGGGPRLCIGNGFAMMEAQLLLATFAQRFHLDLVPGHRVVPEPMITLRPKGALPMRLVAR
ncbi:MAG: cytochrome P450 [Myxococcales bacterium]|nr:cytochrome P450 [Myxococcales bacterium]